MDRRRRRLNPSAEGLESRQLLSVANRPAAIAPATLQQKASRIDKLPRYLQSLQTGRHIPPDLVRALQDDLRQIVGKLSRPTTGSLEAANLQFRNTVANASISREDAAALRATFVKVLESAGAPAPAVTALADDMDALVRVDSASREPALLAANDYALVLQTALGVGRPLRTPKTPSLTPADDSGRKGDRATTDTTPRLVGRYDDGASIQLLNELGQVIGTAIVDRNGQYAVSPTAPLPLGQNRLTVRAADSLSNVSRTSRPVTLTINAAPAVGLRGAVPRGPLLR